MSTRSAGYLEATVIGPRTDVARLHDGASVSAPHLQLTVRADNQLIAVKRLPPADAAIRRSDRTHSHGSPRFSQPIRIDDRAAQYLGTGYKFLDLNRRAANTHKRKRQRTGFAYLNEVGQVAQRAGAAHQSDIPLEEASQGL
jgi:hypothetical protein